MHTLIVVLIACGSIWLTAVVGLCYFVWKAKPYPCDECGLRPAARHADYGRELCDDCYNLYEEKLAQANPSRPREGLVQGPRQV